MFKVLKAQYKNLKKNKDTKEDKPQEIVKTVVADIDSIGDDNSRLLQEAVSSHSIVATKTLLEKNANPNVIDKKTGQTPLHKTAYGLHENDEEIIDLLLKYKAHTHILDNNGSSAYVLAAYRYYYFEHTRVLRSIMFLLSIEGGKYRDAMKEYVKDLSLVESTHFTPHGFNMMCDYFSSDIVLYVIFPYLVPEKPKHPTPDIVKSAEMLEDKAQIDYRFFAQKMQKNDTEIPHKHFITYIR